MLAVRHSHASVNLALLFNVSRDLLNNPSDLLVAEFWEGHGENSQP
jgi:hypothetical protein